MNSEMLKYRLYNLFLKAFTGNVPVVFLARYGEISKTILKSMKTYNLDGLFVVENSRRKNNEDDLTTFLSQTTKKDGEVINFSHSVIITFVDAIAPPAKKVTMAKRNNEYLITFYDDTSKWDYVYLVYSAIVLAKKEALALQLEAQSYV